MKDRMSNFGLSKLTEEIGEVGQVIGKMLQFPECFENRGFQHPDGERPLHERLELEIADVMAACRFVIVKLDLDRQLIDARAQNKVYTFQTWDLEGDRAAAKTSEGAK